MMVMKPVTLFIALTLVQITDVLGSPAPAVGSIHAAYASVSQTVSRVFHFVFILLRSQYLKQVRNSLTRYVIRCQATVQ
jgi:hypothetical protein